MFSSKELSDYIKFLSKRDTKNLSQKTLKTVEEIGELSKKVLPFENAFATNHRIVTKAQILEEIADTMLCLLSVAHDIDASDTDLEAMLFEKASVWQQKQDADLGCSFPIPFEIHVSVKTNNIQLFKTACDEIGVKSIIIDLHNDSVHVMRDVMTSSKHLGDNNSVMSEVQRISSLLTLSGFEVVREKVETVPWHPAAPSKKNSTSEMPKDCYFECHFAVILGSGQDTKVLDSIASDNNLHRSRNIFKTYENGNSVVMLTSRAYDGTYEDFLKKIESAKQDFSTNNFEIEKVIVEFSVYDTKISHDNAWIRKAA